MAQAVSRRSLTAEDRVRVGVSPFGIYGEQSGSGEDFFLRDTWFSPVYHSTMALYVRVSLGGWTIGPLVAAFQIRNSIESILSS
jgi:hypothetical protein